MGESSCYPFTHPFSMTAQERARDLLEPGEALHTYLPKLDANGIEYRKKTDKRRVRSKTGYTEVTTVDVMVKREGSPDEDSVARFGTTLTV